MDIDMDMDLHDCPPFWTFLPAEAETHVPI